VTKLNVLIRAGGTKKKIDNDSVFRCWILQKKIYNFFSPSIEKEKIFEPTFENPFREFVVEFIEVSTYLINVKLGQTKR